MKSHSVVVEKGRPGRDGQPSIGPVYRNEVAKNGFPPLEPHINTAWDVFRAGAEKYPGNRMLGRREFINGKAGPYQWKTYQEVYEEVLRAGSALKQLGAEPGSRIGIYGANCPQWIVAMEACNGYSLVCVPLYDTLGSSAVDYIIEHAELDILFVQDKKIIEILASDGKSARRLKSIISFTSMTAEQSAAAAANFGVKAYSWNEFLEMGKQYPSEPFPPQPLDISTIIYTSGTSGSPKGVILTHEIHAAYVRGVDLFMGQFEDKMTVDDVFISFLPLAHILDRAVEEFFFYKGASVGYYQGDHDALMEDLMELKPTLFAGVPRVFEKIHEGVSNAVAEKLVPSLIFNFLYKFKLFWMRLGYSHKSASRIADLLAFSKVKAGLGGRVRLIICGGAPLSTDIEEFLRVTSCAFFTQGYGLSETCGLTSVGYPDEMSLIGTVGYASTYTELRLEEVPEMGYDPLGVPSRGEICVRGKTLFAGYYKNPELTKEVMRDGWFHTGDIGEFSPEGALKIIDRKKNIFKLSGGENVAVEFLEKAYSLPPVIEDILVYGESDRPVLVAVVAPHEETTKKWAEQNGHTGSFTQLCSLQELKDHILLELKMAAEKNKLKGYEHIKGVVIDHQPFDIGRDLVTPTMKKKRVNMQKYYQDDIEKLYKSLEEMRK